MYPKKSTSPKKIKKIKGHNSAQWNGQYTEYSRQRELNRNWNTKGPQCFYFCIAELQLPWKSTD